MIRDLSYPFGESPALTRDHPILVRPGAVRLSAVAQNDFVNLVNGQGPSTKTGSFTRTPSALKLGPITRGASTENMAITGDIATALGSVTCAAIFTTQSNSGASQVFFTVGGNMDMRYDSDRMAIYASGNALYTSTLDAAASDPWFYAISATNGEILYLQRNLRTGKIRTATAASAYTPGTRNGTITILSPTSGQNFLSGGLAACMYKEGRSKMDDLIRWSEDPWLFWYPYKNARVGG